MSNSVNIKGINSPLDFNVRRYSSDKVAETYQIKKPFNIN